MKSRLPATLLETLSISGPMRTIIKTIHKYADTFGSWKYPSKKAPGDFDKMKLLEKIHLGYKSKNPIVYPEKGSQVDAFFKKHSKPLPLPEGFEKKHSVTFSAVGDLYKVEGLENSKDKLYEEVADLIFDKNISYANLESQLTGREVGKLTFNEKETPPLCCTKEQYEAFKGHKEKQFILMHTASNHTLDMGVEGLETTLAQLEKDDIMDLGTNREPEEQQMGRIIEIKGMRIGFVSATYGLNGKEVPKGKEYMVNVVEFHPRDPDKKKIDLTLLKEQISFCKEQKCDIIMASLHWGYEYEFFPRLKQIVTAHALVEAGVDVIISHHSHVIQPVEFYRPRRDPGRTAVIVYSLGNLTNPYSAPHLVLSGILNLTLVKGTINGQEKTFVEDVKLTPVVQRDLTEGGVPVIRLEKLETFSSGKGFTTAEKDYIAAVQRYAQLVLGEKK